MEENMSKMQSKREAQDAHARRRAKERYGLYFHQDLCNTFVQKIKKSSENAVYGQANALFIARDTLRIKLWMVHHENAWYPVCYDRDRQTVVTFLPIDFMRTKTAEDFATRIGRKIVIVDESSILLEEVA
jgi:hypothetical protein